MVEAWSGIIPARLLELLSAEDPRIISQADIVAGTSTGGLIALGLARGKTPSELCEIYLEKAKVIFSSSNRRYDVVRPIKAKFDPAGLRDAVNAITGDATLGDLTEKHVFVPVTALSRPDSSHRPAGVFLSTCYRMTDRPELERFSSSKWKCVDVALATAAAPTYFPAHKVDNPDLNQGGKWVLLGRRNCREQSSACRGRRGVPPRYR